MAAERRPRGSRRTPQVGASTQEIGRTQSGRMPIGTRNPQISQTGSSKRVAQCPGRCGSGPTVTLSRKPSIPIGQHGHRHRGREEQRVLDAHVDAEQRTGPRAGSRPCCRAPTVAIAVVIGSSTSGNGVGAATSSSRVPDRRSRCERPRSRSCSPPTRRPSRWRRPRRTAAPGRRRPTPYMRNAIVAKKSGQSTLQHPVERRAAAHLELEPPPRASTGAAGRAHARTSSGSSAPSLARACGVGSRSPDQLDVRVLERRLAGGDPADAVRRSSSASTRWVTSAPGSARTTSTCAWPRSSTADRPDARQRLHLPRSAASATPNTSTSTTVPLADPALELGRRALGDDPAAGDDRDPVAQLVGLEHVVRGQQHRRAGVDAGPRRWCAARGRRPGRCRCDGSSRNSTSGLCSRPRAMCSRWRMPRE